jgi:predicted MFS family arabinose efflux permease
VLLSFREPQRAEGACTPTVGETLKNFLTVLRNPKFMIFLLVFTGYWIVFWQQWIVLPVYLHTYVDKNIDVELVLVTDGIVVITCTILINHLLRKLPAFSAIVLGTLVTSLSWVVLALRPSMSGAVISIFVLAVGEIIQQPRYYEYISRLAPPEQQGTYMGFAFLPLGIGSLIGGWFGGRLLRYFGEVQGKPELVWYVIIAVGLLTTLLLWIYDRVVKPARELATA